MRAADVFVVLIAGVILASITPCFAVDYSKPSLAGRTAGTTAAGSVLESDTLPRWMTLLPYWMSPTTPNVGSPAWKREQAETELHERAIRRVIAGVCRGC